MDIFLDGHTYKYAAEQMLLTLYPGERPAYPAEDHGGDAAFLSLRRGTRYAVCRCALRRDGALTRGESRVALQALADPLSEAQLLQRAVKSAFFKAAVAAGHAVPPWGALTGVRPGKLFASLLRQGCTEREATRRFREEFYVSAERTELCRRTVRASLAARATLGGRDACLYVGIPFCPTRCAYCSFISLEAGRSLTLLPDYLKALERELETLSARVAESGVRIVSVYIGGGTPTVLSAAQLERLCALLRRLFDWSACREFCVEAGRPDTITAEKLAVLRAQGVTRLNVNPQTMCDAVLEAIGRRHTAADIADAMALVRRGGDFAVNMDLIAGLPGDTPAQFSQTLSAVFALAPENITVHTLALKKGSTLAKESTPLPAAEAVSAMLDEANTRLAAAGYEPYYLYRQKFMAGSFENIGWAKPGYENFYNMCIMEELTGILAAGAGSSTKLVTPGGSVERLMDVKYPREYIERIDTVCEAKSAIPAFYRQYYPTRT